MSVVTATFVTNELERFKAEILADIKTQITTCITTALKDFKEEIKKDIEEWKAEQKEIMDEKIEAAEKKYQLMLNEQKKELEEMKNTCELIIKRQVEQEDRGRRLNLVVSGLEPNENFTCQQIVEQMFVRDLKIPQDSVDAFIYRNIHYIGNFKPGKSRSIIIAFCRQTDRDLVFSKASELKGTRISLRPNYSPETRNIRDELMKKRIELKAENLKVRLVEKFYKPELQVLQRNGKWLKYTPPTEDDDEVGFLSAEAEDM